MVENIRWEVAGKVVLRLEQAFTILITGQEQLVVLINAAVELESLVVGQAMLEQQPHVLDVSNPKHCQSGSETSPTKGSSRSIEWRTKMAMSPTVMCT